MEPPDAAAWVVLGREGDDITAVAMDAAAGELSRHAVTAGDLAAWVARVEASQAVRWVWSDATRWYPRLLAEGVRVARCHDLRLCHAILRDAASVRDEAVRLATAWDAASIEDAPATATLFDLDDAAPGASGVPEDIGETVAEFGRQRAAAAASTDPARLRLLLAAESAGALLAAELRAAGVPWDPAAHERILVDVLGERPASGGASAKVDAAARRVREALGDPAASLDSQPKLLRSLHRAGVLVESTSRWELARQRHPVIEPLLEYKKLSRLQSANGWAWLGEWVRDGRFRPVYVPGGVVTGRWATSGGGALQLPRQLRAAVRADPG